MTEHVIRLDRFGREHVPGSGYSTVLVAEIDMRSLHWGNASYRGETSPIVALKYGFLSIVVDEWPGACPYLQALHDRWRHVRDPALQRVFADTPTQDRRDAAEAARLANNCKLAAQLEPAVLFEPIACGVLDTYVSAVTHDLTVLTAMIDRANVAIDRAHQSGIFDGQALAKEQLRRWLWGERVELSERYDDRVP